mmetsp:Transcript_11851/g.28123  ORF Transcript_11851/g.28123 Transcript_11851/m.28123 type:complete len:215 (+) Transcript_11851:1649-2293(+)
MSGSPASSLPAKGRGTSYAKGGARPSGSLLSSESRGARPSGSLLSSHRAARRGMSYEKRGPSPRGSPASSKSRGPRPSGCPMNLSPAAIRGTSSARMPSLPRKLPRKPATRRTGWRQSFKGDPARHRGSVPSCKRRTAARTSCVRASARSAAMPMQPWRPCRRRGPITAQMIPRPKDACVNQRRTGGPWVRRPERIRALIRRQGQETVPGPWHP